tara:strand:+ start:118 stop:909 length:792 start_codon:yes stop_codon:yes gene_type:complete
MEVEPELFKYDFQVNERKLLGYHKDDEIPEARLSELAGHIRNFYLRYKSKQFPPGTLQDLLFEFLEGFVGLTEQERHSDDFNRLLLTQPGGAPRQDGDRKDLQIFTQEYFRDKEAQETGVVPETPRKLRPFKPRFPQIDGEELAPDSSDESHVSETESEAESETDRPMETTWNKEYDNFPYETFANEEEDGIPLSLNKKLQDQKENYEPMEEDEKYAIDEGSQLNLTLTPKNKYARGGLPPLPLSRFIATPLGWSLLEIPSCS